jgi:hypothetical protein
MAEPVTFKLSKPISDTGGAPLNEITLKVPNGGNLRRCGAPYVFEYRPGAGEPLMHINTQSIAKLIEELAGVPAGSVDALSAPDFNELQGIVLGFFTPEIAAALSKGSSLAIN